MTTTKSDPVGMQCDKHVLGRLTSTEAGPTLVVMVGIHGNERAGVEGAKRVLARLAREKPPLAGDLIVLAGNLPALARGTRFIDLDLNRQWISATQPEPRAWMKKWHEWRPNVSVDYHEMGSQQTYYFAPGVASRTHPLIPDEGMQLVAEVVQPAEAFMD